MHLKKILVFFILVEFFSEPASIINGQTTGPVERRLRDDARRLALAVPSEPSFQENYFGYQYPGLPASSINVPFMRALAEGHEAYRKGNLDLTVSAYSDAISAFESEWNRTAASSPITRTKTVLDQRYAQFTSGTPFGGFLLGRRPPEVDRIVQYVTKYQLEPTGARDPGATAWDWHDRALFTWYYYRHFFLELTISDALSDGGQYEDALRRLFRIYYESNFKDKRATNTPLEKWKEYGTPPFPEAITLTATEVNNETNRFLVDLNLAPDYSKGLLPLEKKLITIKIAELYFKWGDFLYRHDDPDAAKGKYMQILRIYIDCWNDVFNSSGGTDLTKYNPKILELVLAADLQITKISGNLNYFGYPKDYVPVWNYSYLRQIAQYFIGQAKGLERDALNFLGSAEHEAEQNLLIEQSISIAVMTIDLEQSKVELEETNKDIANANLELSTDRLNHMNEQVKLFEKNNPVATGKGMHDLGLTKRAGTLNFDVSGIFDKIPGSRNAVSGFLVSEVGNVGSFGSEEGGFVGSIFGWSTSGPSQMRQKEEYYLQMKNQALELESAVQIAKLEVQRAEKSLEIAKKSKAIAEADLVNKKNHLVFAKSKILNEEFWYRLSREVRSKAHHYLEYGIELAWLTQRAFEFEQNREINLIKLEYLSSENWLATDQLLLDLDSIEYSRITSRKQKDIPVSQIISLRRHDPLAFQSLIDTGQMEFSTYEWDFDFLFPGTYNRRIKKVELLIPALVSPSGFHGTLTKSEFSTVRYYNPNATVDSSLQMADWIQYTSCPYKLSLLKHESDTMIISGVGPIISSPPIDTKEEGTRELFEGHGVTGNWTLSLPKSANDFDFKTIADVVLKIEFTANFDSELRDEVQRERRRLTALNKLPNTTMYGYSLSQLFPDQWYHFHNPFGEQTNSSSQRLLPFQVDLRALPNNQLKQILKEFWISFIGENGAIDVKAKVTSGLINNLKNLNMAEASKIKVEDLRWFPSIGESFETIQDDSGEILAFKTDKLQDLGANLIDTWIMRIDAADNPQLSLPGSSPATFDPKKLESIKDVIVSFGYEYLPAGKESIPVYAWSDFNGSDAGDIALYVGAKVHDKKQWSVESGTWSIDTSKKKLKHTSAATATTDTLRTPDDAGPLPDEFYFSVELSAGANVSNTLASVAFWVNPSNSAEGYKIKFDKYHPPAGVVLPSGSYWQTRIYKNGSQLNAAPSVSDVIPEGTPVTLEVFCRRSGTGTSKEIAWKINGHDFFKYTDNTPLQATGFIRIEAKGDIYLDSFEALDLTARTDISTDNF